MSYSIHIRSMPFVYIKYIILDVTQPNFSLATNGSSTNQLSNFGLLFLREICVFPNFVFFIVCSETLMPKDAYRP